MMIICYFCQGRHEIAGIYCILMLLSSDMAELADKFGASEAPDQMKTPDGGAFTSHRGR